MGLRACRVKNLNIDLGPLTPFYPAFIESEKKSISPKRADWAH